MMAMAMAKDGRLKIMVRPAWNLFRPKSMHYGCLKTVNRSVPAVVFTSAVQQWICVVLQALEGRLRCTDQRQTSLVVEKPDVFVCKTYGLGELAPSLIARRSRLSRSRACRAGVSGYDQISFSASP